MSSPSNRLFEACDKATNIMLFHSMGRGVYALETSGEVSLVDKETLLSLLRQRLGGGANEVGGGSVAGA